MSSINGPTEVLHNTIEARPAEPLMSKETIEKVSKFLAGLLALGCLAGVAYLLYRGDISPNPKISVTSCLFSVLVGSAVLSTLPYLCEKLYLYASNSTNRRNRINH